MTAPASACPACHTPLPEDSHFCPKCGAATPTEPGVPPRTMATGAVEVATVRRALAEQYRIERVLGEGGMATVYLADDLKHHRKVAVKVMRPELAATLGVDRFLREIEIAAQLSHPHILPVYDSGSSAGVLYYVMPYVQGESLRERLQREGRLPVDEALRLAREVAEALGYAHRQGIIHRDIKPANVMLSEGHALVADFGIARGAGGGQVLTQTGLAVGTPQYMSPEQASGERDIDARSDVYAIGAMLYEMLAGAPPYTGATPQAVFAKSLTEDITPLPTLRPDVPAPVADVVARATVRAPSGRYASGSEMEQALASARDAVRSGASPAAVAGPSPARVWGLFGVAAIAALAVDFALVSRLALASWTLGLTAALLVVGAAALVVTGRIEARRRAGVGLTGLVRRVRWRNAAHGGGLALGLWLTVVLVLVFRGPGAGASTSEGIRLAVLPFENRGNPADDYVVAGITDQVRGKLAGLAGFQVTARTSSEQYRRATKSPAEIGRELGVRYLLSGTVNWEKNASGGGRVQVMPELIDARSGDVTWQQSFDAALTDLFQVQAEVAVRVAGALNVALGAGERRDLAAPPTRNLAAYDAFLKGEEEDRKGSITALRRAVDLYEQAVALDSTFARAWARLSETHGRISFTSPSREAAAGALHGAERARALAPEAPESYAAMGYYYSNVRFDFPRSLREFEEGLRRAPNDPALLAATANIDRSLGRWEESLSLLRRAQSLDPRNVSIQGSLATHLLWMHRFDEALATLDAAQTLSPDNPNLILTRVMVHAARGDLAAARAAIRAVPPTVETTSLVAFLAQTWDMYWVMEDEQQRLVLRLPPGSFDDDRGAWALAIAGLSYVRGDLARMRAYGDTARIWFDGLLRDTPDDNYLLALSSLALAYAGRRDDAIRNGERAVALLPIGRDGFSGPYNLSLLVRAYTVLGEKEKAIDGLEQLLRVPFYYSPAWLRIDPDFASLRGHPRFQRLIAGG
jgi:eukaryotic-like serine/threonine-protein kinase